MHMVFLSRGFKNLQWYSMTKRMISYEIILFYCIKKTTGNAGGSKKL